MRAKPRFRVQIIIIFACLRDSLREPFSSTDTFELHHAVKKDDKASSVYGKLWNEECRLRKINCQSEGITSKICRKFCITLANVRLMNTSGIILGETGGWKLGTGRAIVAIFGKKSGTRWAYASTRIQYRIEALCKV